MDLFPSLVDLVCSCHHTSIAISDNTSPYGNHCHLATLVTTVCWARTRVSFARESRAVSALTLCSAASRLKYQASRQPNTNPIMRRCHDTSFLPADTGPHSALGIGNGYHTARCCLIWQWRCGGSYTVHTKSTKEGKLSTGLLTRTTNVYFIKL